ncbi:lmo0937 family membrane protein [Marivirga lumbricoides]|uniref:Lmo0937 family membrane protein n=1 Tax=Marivirga lumbricoides TaxID=1046115 RepID=A0A2T4DL31_9BACT|nr:lmo0937 family membrane protein [Marivirga lumbricoides]
MSKVLIPLALILLIGWAIGLFIYSIGVIIHLLLVLAVIFILIKVIKWRSDT